MPPNISTPTSTSNVEKSFSKNIEDESECIICFTQYNEEKNRPRSLPCGHTLCTKCLEENISKRTTKCPKCIRRYYAANVNDIPINYSLESVLKLLSSNEINNRRKELSVGTKSPLNKKQRVIETNKPETLPECVEHQLPLIKRCSTHRAWICENCLIDDHSSETSTIITLSEELELKKVNQRAKSNSFLNTFEKTRKASGDLSKLCKEQLNERDEEITTFETIAKKIQEMIQAKKESRRNLEELCNGFDQKLETLKSKRICLDLALISLNSADTIRKVSQCSVEVQNESEKLQLITNDIKHEMDKMLRALHSPPESGGAAIGLTLGNHSLSVRDGMYHLHAMQGKTAPQSEHYCLHISDEIENAPLTDGILTFLDIAWPGQQSQRLYIKIIGNTCRARQHLLLSVGQCGQSYRGLNFEKLLYKDQPGELLQICSYDGADAKPLLNDVTVNDVIAHDVKAGLVTGTALDEDTDDSNTALFAVYLRNDPGYVSSSVFGTVTQGLDILMKIAESKEMENIKIIDCGVVLF